MLAPQHFTPFFSLFNSAIRKKSNPITIVLKNKNNKTISKKKIFNELKKPFENKIFYLNDYFSIEELKKSSFCVIKTLSAEVFPRMVCGNYHEKEHHYEVTHSFPVQYKKDYINNDYLKNKRVHHLSILPFIKSKKMNLKLRVFPTNNKSNLNTKLFVYNNKTKKMDYIKSFRIKTGEKNFEYKVKKNYRFGFFSAKQKNIPARINTSYIYTKNNKNYFSSDIATGFKSIDYPPKRSHWGSFLFNQNTVSELLIRRLNHFKTNQSTIGYLTFYGNGSKKKIKIKLKPTDYKIISMSKYLKSKSKILKSCSWYANFNNGTGVEIFSNTSGKNFTTGDHSF